MDVKQHSTKIKTQTKQLTFVVSWRKNEEGEKEEEKKEEKKSRKENKMRQRKKE